MKPRHILYIVLAVLTAIVFVWKAMLGFVMLVLLGLFWVVNKATRMEDADRLKKYGPELAQKIKEGKVEIGMSREVVELMWGKGANEKRRVDASGTTLHCEHALVAGDGTKRYRYFATYHNDVLVEFGDR